jgi:hypothetical protein
MRKPLPDRLLNGFDEDSSEMVLLTVDKLFTEHDLEYSQSNSLGSMMSMALGNGKHNV